MDSFRAALPVGYCPRLERPVPSARRFHWLLPLLRTVTFLGASYGTFKALPELKKHLVVGSVFVVVWGVWEILARPESPPSKV